MTQKDWFLAGLNSTAQAFSEGGSFNITLFVGGVVLAGDVISGQAYFGALKASFQEKGGAIAKIGDAIASAVDTADAAELAAETIHMKNVVMLSATGEQTPFAGGLFRVRVDAVDGFTLGGP